MSLFNDPLAFSVLSVLAKNSEGPELQDTLSFDVPTFIRFLEWAREGVKADNEIHDVVSALVENTRDVVINMGIFKQFTGSED